MKRKKLTDKQYKRSMVKQWKAIERGDIPKTGRYDPIVDFALTAEECCYGDMLRQVRWKYYSAFLSVGIVWFS